MIYCNLYNYKIFLLYYNILRYYYLEILIKVLSYIQNATIQKLYIYLYLLSVLALSLPQKKQVMELPAFYHFTALIKPAKTTLKYRNYFKLFCSIQMKILKIHLFHLHFYYIQPLKILHI